MDWKVIAALLLSAGWLVLAVWSVKRKQKKAGSTHSQNQAQSLNGPSYSVFGGSQMSGQSKIELHYSYSQPGEGTVENKVLIPVQRSSNIYHTSLTSELPDNDVCADDRFYLKTSIDQQIESKGSAGQLDDVSFIQEMKHIEADGPWQQYDILVVGRGYGWNTMVNWAQYMADGDLKAIDTLSAALMAYSKEIEFIEQFKERGGRIASIPDLVEEEWSSLAVGGHSKTLHTPVKIVWFNQTRIIRIFSWVKDEVQMRKYAETVIRRTFGAEDEMKLAKPYNEIMSETPKKPPEAPAAQKRSLPSNIVCVDGRYYLKTTTMIREEALSIQRDKMGPTRNVVDSKKTDSPQLDRHNQFVVDNYGKRRCEPGEKLYHTLQDNQRPDAKVTALRTHLQTVVSSAKGEVYQKLEYGQGRAWHTLPKNDSFQCLFSIDPELFREKYNKEADSVHVGIMRGDGTPCICFDKDYWGLVGFTKSDLEIITYEDLHEYAKLASNRSEGYLKDLSADTWKSYVGSGVPATRRIVRSDDPYVPEEKCAADSALGLKSLVISKIESGACNTQQEQFVQLYLSEGQYRLFGVVSKNNQAAYLWVDLVILSKEKKYSIPEDRIKGYVENGLFDSDCYDVILTDQELRYIKASILQTYEDDDFSEGYGLVTTRVGFTSDDDAMYCEANSQYTQRLLRVLLRLASGGK